MGPKTEKLTREQIALRVEELAQIKADMDHYLGEHNELTLDMLAEINAGTNFSSNQGLSRACSRGHVISVLFKGKDTNPTTVDPFRPIAMRRPSGDVPFPSWDPK